jgi:hypothetical protein
VLGRPLSRLASSGVGAEAVPGAIVLAMLAGGVVLWAAAVRNFDVRQINDLGLVSQASPAMLIGIALIAMAFALSLRLRVLSAPMALLATLLLVLTVHGLPTFVEDAPRFPVAYLHAGFTDFIATTGGLLPDVDARFSWPVFFSLGALVTKVAGIANAVQMQPWAPLVTNVLYLPPLLVIFGAISSDRRVVWTALFVFYATNWVGQDYYSPQAFAYLLYLTVLAILLRWFRVEQVSWVGRQLARFRAAPAELDGVDTTVDGWRLGPPPIPATPTQRAALLAIIVLLTAVSVASHQLTPFALLGAVTALTLLRRTSLPGLPVLVAVLTGMWISYMTVAFLSGHLVNLLNDLGAAAESASQNVAQRLAGSDVHVFVVQFRLAMTVVLWALAALGFFRRVRHGHLDLEAAALAAVPFGLMALQAYGGEMLLRVYLFSLPFMSFLAAGAFFPEASRPTRSWTTAKLGGVAVFLVLALMVTKHGNERADRMSADEFSAVQRLYAMAPMGSMLGSANYASPLRYRDFAAYDYAFVEEPLLKGDVKGVIAALEPGDRCVYLLLSRAQLATAELYEGVADSSWATTEKRLVQSGHFSIAFQSPDAQVLVYTPAPNRCVTP